MRVALLSNVNIRAVCDELRKINGDLELYVPDGYGLWMQELLGDNSPLVNFSPELLFLILDGSELIRGLSEGEVLGILDTIRSFVDKHTYLHLFVSELDVWCREILPNDVLSRGRLLEWEWNRRIYELSGQRERVHVFKLKELIEREGRKAFYSDKLWYLGGIRYSSYGSNVIAHEIDVLIRSYKRSRKKVLVLDLDNTLWGGVLGEVGLDDIELSDVKEGSRYKDFQRRVKELKDLGVLLAICSKNNESEVMEVFERHEHMVLKREDFVAMRINWEGKVRNIEEIASELNLALDSLVFVDDSPVERELVKRSLPCEVPEFPSDTSKLNDFAWDLYKRYFYVLKVSFEDVKRTEMYLQEKERERLRREAVSLEDYLRSLGMRMKIKRLEEGDVRRAAELTQRTNQFNLTNLRLTEAQVRERLSNPTYSAYIASVEDRFGDNGKVLLAFVRKDVVNGIAEFENLLMSCRVFGRYLEDQFVGFIEDELAEEGFKLIKARYVPTARNKPAEDFFDRLGYKVVLLEGGEKLYELALKDSRERKAFADIEYEG